MKSRIVWKILRIPWQLIDCDCTLVWNLIAGDYTVFKSSSKAVSETKEAAIGKSHDDRLIDVIDTKGLMDVKPAE